MTTPAALILGALLGWLIAEALNGPDDEWAEAGA